MSERKKGSGTNPNSLANLQPHNKTEAKKKLTKSLLESMCDYLEKDKAYFYKQMKTLKGKEFIDAYMKLMSMVAPKEKEPKPTTTTTNNTVNNTQIDVTLQDAPKKLPVANNDLFEIAIEVPLKNKNDE